jgi:hypothetical protein
MTIDTLRHYELVNPRDYDNGITVIGAGAVGSRVFSHLIEFGFENITVYDPDIVESHNIANQLYGNSDIGQPKVEALRRWTSWKLGIRDNSPNFPRTLHFVQDYVTPETPIQGYVFLLVDSLEERGKLATAMGNNISVPRIIDVRMAAMHLNVFVFSPHTMLRSYLETLGNDEDAEVSSCGSPFSVTTTAAAAASLAVSSFVHCVQHNDAAVSNRLDLYLGPYTLGTSKL